MGRFLDLAAKAESVVHRVKSKDLTVKHDEVYVDSSPCSCADAIPERSCAKSVKSAKSTLDDGSWTEDDIAWTEAALSKYYGCEIKLYDHWRDIPVAHVSGANDRIVPTSHGCGQEQKSHVRQETLWSTGHNEEGLEAA
jgi:hypothetical protein